MSNELRPDDLGEVWRRQKVEHTQMTLDEIRARARKFQRRILFRNFRECAAIAVVVVFFGATMGKYPPLMRAAAGRADLRRRLLRQGGRLHFEKSGLAH